MGDLSGRFGEAALLCALMLSDGNGPGMSHIATLALELANSAPCRQSRVRSAQQAKATEPDKQMVDAAVQV